MLASFLAIAPADASSLTAEKRAAADALVARFLSRVDASPALLPGAPKAALSLAIGNERTLLLAKGYGDCAPGVPVTEHTVYHVGSLAKQFTAAAVLDLIGRKARLRDGTPLTLDLALAQIFEGVEHWPRSDAETGKQPVTLRTLLTMTSNLPNFTRLPPSATDPWGRIAAPELLSELKKLKPSGWPNTFEYSNTSYFLLAEAIEEAVAPGEQAPRAHRDRLRRTLFARAGLRETGFVGDYMPNTVVAPAIYRRKPVFDQPDWLKGSADIASSATDIYAWNAALMNGRVLPSDLVALMVSDGARVTPDLYYGMGWFVEHRRKAEIYTHSGHVPGYTSYSLISAASAKAGAPAWTSVTLLVNTDVVEGLETLAEELLYLASE
ncbi:serine hydrolase domain-containing protein [Hyphomicrobium sp. CS1GBMeth3]|uniref:serine hydrolase domain-containing protein n=1 Tax=Hyphomicrobium sp. CS1GBMeth3 TaxID=1892845 RepID=UPI000931C212|nr:serine hydrolase domain-containing protein [Hyphomicrobium sp. CS1GBMeth3]